MATIFDHPGLGKIKPVGEPPPTPWRLLQYYETLATSLSYTIDVPEPPKTYQLVIGAVSVFHQADTGITAGAFLQLIDKRIGSDSGVRRDNHLYTWMVTNNSTDNPAGNIASMAISYMPTGLLFEKEVRPKVILTVFGGASILKMGFCLHYRWQKAE